MGHAAQVSAAAATTAHARPPYRTRVSSVGSFHAGDVFPSFEGGPSAGRRPSTSHSAASRRRMAADTSSRVEAEESIDDRDDNYNDSSSSPSTPRRDDDRDDDRHGRRNRRRRTATPLPVRQLGLLAVLSLAEQTSLNSISPYLPTMVGSFAEIPPAQMGLYVGLLASAFALAQLATNLLWGYLSDAVGRKPIMLLGSFNLVLCFGLFGFCTRYWHVVVLLVAMGLLNGNAAVVPTALGEVTDRSNQSSAFAWLPVVYSLGSITGPALGGLLAGRPLDGDSGGSSGDRTRYPFLAPNLVSAAVLAIAVVVVGLWFDETLELDPCDRQPLPRGFGWIHAIARRCTSLRPDASSSGASGGTDTPSESSPLLAATDGDVTPTSDDNMATTDSRCVNSKQSSDPSSLSSSLSVSSSSAVVSMRQLLSYKTVLLLLTYLVFQLSNISFNSLYPIFSAAPAPTGRAMPPGTIGLLLSFAGLVTMVFQVTAFQPLKARLGNLGSYRGALFGLALSTMLMPWVCHGDDDGAADGTRVGTSSRWLYGEVAAVLVLKNICAVGGLSSVMLLINNSAPSNETLGTLNGIAQTLSAAGRSVGPFLSGALFSVSTHIHPKGELLAWGVFGGVATLGWLLSLFVDGKGLESADEADGADDGHSDSCQDRDV